MNIKIRWYNIDKTVILLEFGRDWAWEDLYALQTQLVAMRQETGHAFGYLVHAPHTHELPPGLSVTRLRKALMLEEKERFIILVGTSLFVQMMMSSIMSLLGMDQRSRLHFASTLHEAQPILTDQLATLQQEMAYAARR